MSRIVAVALLGAALAACGGNETENAGSGRLETKADVLREIGQFGRFLDVGAPLYGEAPSQGSPSFTFNAATIPATDCESGAVTALQSSRPTEFEYFDTAETGDYRTYRFTTCATTNRSDASVAYEQDGVLEIGELRGYDATNLADTFYTSFAYGDDATDYSYFRNVSDVAGNIVEQVIEQVYGRIERAGDDTGSRTGAVITRLITRSLPDGYTLAWQQGKPGSPLYSDFDLGPNGGFRVRGPIDYESSQCAGGIRSIVIPAAGVLVNDGVPVDGTLNLSLAGSTLILGFDEDGATATFGVGQTARLTRAEILAAMSDPEC